MTTENSLDTTPLPAPENKIAENVPGKTLTNCFDVLGSNKVDELRKTENNFKPMEIEIDCTQNKLSDQDGDPNENYNKNRNNYKEENDFKITDSLKRNSLENQELDLEESCLEDEEFKVMKTKQVLQLLDNIRYKKANEINKQIMITDSKTETDHKLTLDKCDGFVGNDENSIKENNENVYKLNFSEPFKEIGIGSNDIEKSKINGNYFIENKFIKNLDFSKHKPTDDSSNRKFLNNESEIHKDNLSEDDNTGIENSKPNHDSKINEYNLNTDDVIILSKNKNDFEQNGINSSINIIEQDNNSIIDGIKLNENKLENSNTHSQEIIPSKACEVKLEDFLNEITQNIVNAAVKTTDVKENKTTDDYSNSEDEIDDDFIPRVRRSSSLKTYKTPPGTPCSKKIVRFADVLGLDLADVRTFLDDIPKIPNYAYKDLENANMDIPDNTKSLLVLFQQQGGQANFLDKLRIKNVMLENVIVENHPNILIRGLIRVVNLDFHKSVHVRYTTDSWKSFSDLQANYNTGSFDGFSDKFSFLLHADMLNIGERVEFAVRYRCKQKEFWDNNNGGNYCLQCMPVARPVQYADTSTLDDQIASFYYKGNDVDLKSSTVQDFIMNSLGTTEKQKLTQASKPEIFIIFLFVLLSIVLLYIKQCLFEN